MKMKILKKLMFCAAYSLICSNTLLGAIPMFSQSSNTIRTIGKQVMRRIPTGASIPYSWEVYRNHTNYYGSGENDQRTKVQGSSLSDNLRLEQNANAAELLSQIRVLTRILMKHTEAFNLQQTHFQATPAPNLVHQPDSLAVVERKISPITRLADRIESQESSMKEMLKTSPTRQVVTKDNNRNQHSSDTAAKMREEFIEGIMQCIKVSNIINQQDVISIIDLYGALPNRPKEALTKVLNGQINSDKSSIYNEIQKYAESKRATIVMFRDMYSRLSEAFGKDAMQIVYQVVAKKRLEIKKKIEIFQRSTKNNRKHEDCMALLVHCADPLYPVNVDDVEMLLNLYAAFPNQPREAITKVLNGRVNSDKSSTFQNVQKYLLSKQSNLTVCRNVYARLSQSANGNAIQILYSMLEKK